MTNYYIQNSQVLVTGGAGFIGSNLCEALLSKNNQVVCLDNFSTGFRKNLEGFISHPNFTLIEGDIRELAICEKAVKGCDYVLHQAALGSVPRSLKDPCTSIDVNISGFTNMLWASVQEGIQRFVYAASSSTYGDHQTLPKQEHIIGKPLSPYAITKYVNEMIAENFTKSYGVETIGLRYFNVFGRRQNPNGAYAAVIPKFIQCLLDGESPVINGDGTNSRDFTYIDNVIEANQRAATTSGVKIQERQRAYYEEINALLPSKENNIYEVINIAHGERTDLNQLFLSIKKCLVPNYKDILTINPTHGPSRSGDIPHSHASIKKANSLIGYTPKYDFHNGIKNTIHWYVQHLPSSNR